jgi:hypothetical protein
MLWWSTQALLDNESIARSFRMIAISWYPRLPSFEGIKHIRKENLSQRRTFNRNASKIMLVNLVTVIIIPEKSIIESSSVPWFEYNQRYHNKIVVWLITCIWCFTSKQCSRLQFPLPFQTTRLQRLVRKVNIILLKIADAWMLNKTLQLGNPVLMRFFSSISWLVYLLLLTLILMTI